MSKAKIITIIALTLTLSACGGGGGGSGGNSGSGGNGSRGTPTITNMINSYSPDGTTKTVTTSYSDGTTSNFSFNQTSLTYSFDADGSQRTPIYSYSDGSMHEGAVQSSASTTYTYNNDGSQRTPTYTFADGTRKEGAMQTATSITYDYTNDGSQRTPTYYYGTTETYQGQVQIATSTAYAYSADGSKRIPTYTYADRTTQIGAQQTAISMAYSYSNDGSKRKPTYTYADNTTRDGVTQTARSTAYSYSDDGRKRIPTYTYNDRTTQNGATQTATSTTFNYNADGSQRTPVYQYADGTPYTGATQTGTALSSTYNNEGNEKTITYSLQDQTTYSITLTGTPNITWGSDHITKTTTYSFADNTNHSMSEIVQPTDIAAVLSAAQYPSDWSTGHSAESVIAPSVTPHKKHYGDDYEDTIEDGTATKPFQQATLAPLYSSGTAAINDPNAYVKFVADAVPLTNYTPKLITFDLRWGIPDRDGPAYANYFYEDGQIVDRQMTSPIFVFESWLAYGNSLNDVECVSNPTNAACGPWFKGPTKETFDAWSLGWTGLQSNILILDNLFNGPQIDLQPAIVWTVAHSIAWGAKFYGRSFIANTNIYDQSGLTPSPTSFIKFHAINMSFSANRQSYFYNNPNGTEDNFRQSVYNYASSLVSDLKNADYSVNLSAHYNFSDAVIAKAAGNDNQLDVQYEPIAYFLAYKYDNRNRPIINADIAHRLLIVGALDKAGSSAPDSGASILPSSNVAGTDWLIQSRFLVADGTVPFYTNDISYNQQVISDNNAGTSYAAPRVAAYAAIIRQKFPNLTAANTADLLLATARYDTLSCFPYCSKAIYGQGEASLSHALAPVGYLH